jgi:hypothetical protein
MFAQRQSEARFSSLRGGALQGRRSEQGTAGKKLDSGSPQQNKDEHEEEEEYDALNNSEISGAQQLGGTSRGLP